MAWKSVTMMAIHDKSWIQMIVVVGCSMEPPVGRAATCTMCSVIVY